MGRSETSLSVTNGVLSPAHVLICSCVTPVSMGDRLKLVWGGLIFCSWPNKFDHATLPIVETRPSTALRTTLRVRGFDLDLEDGIYQTCPCIQLCFTVD